MKLLCTLSKKENITKLRGLVDGIICGSHFCDRHHYSLSTLKELALKAKESSLELYILIDVMIKEKDRALLYEYLEFIKTLDVDGIYYSDLAVLNIAKKLHMQDLLIYESDTLMTNSLDVAFTLKQGIKSVVLAREITLEEILRIASHNDGKVDLHIFGYQKMSSSKRKFLSNYFNHIGKRHDINCNENLRIVEETRDGFMPILENKNGTKIYSDFIMCMYEESLLLKDKIGRGIIDDMFIEEKVLFQVLKDYQMLNGDNAKLLENNLKLRFNNLTFDSGYLYQKTNTTK